jgi:hypothetical protein
MKQALILYILITTLPVFSQEINNHKYDITLLSENHNRNNIYFQNYYSESYVNFCNGSLNLLSYMLPEFLIDYSNNEYHPAAIWEFPIGVILSDVSHFIVPSYIYYPNSKKKGFIIMYYYEVFPRINQNTPEGKTIIHIGGGYITDYFGSGPKLDVRFQFGGKGDYGMGGFFMNISYSRNVKNKNNRYQVSMGVEMVPSLN